MIDTTVTTVDAGPRTVSLRTLVKAKAEELFALLANPHRHHEVDGTGTVQEQVSGPTRLHEGDQFTVAMQVDATAYQLTSTVTRVITDRLIEWRHPVQHKWRWEFEQLEDGNTMVTETFDYAGTPAAPVYELIQIPDHNAVGIHRSLTRLQAKFAAS